MNKQKKRYKHIDLLKDKNEELVSNEQAVINLKFEQKENDNLNEINKIASEETNNIIKNELKTLNKTSEFDEAKIIQLDNSLETKSINNDLTKNDSNNEVNDIRQNKNVALNNEIKKLSNSLSKDTNIKIKDINKNKLHKNVKKTNKKEPLVKEVKKLINENHAQNLKTISLENKNDKPNDNLTSLKQEEKINLISDKPIPINTTKKKRTHASTYIFSLGGVGEIGKNMYVFEHEEEILIIDAGIKFGDESLPGINGIIPSFSYLKENEKKIKALIVTHGHEDHIGAIPYLLRQVNVPEIWAGKLTCELIRKKLSEYKDIKFNNLKPFNDETTFSTKHFDVEFCRVAHSIPDAFGVAITSPNGIIFETGDFRFDFSTYGDQLNIAQAARIGAKDVAVLLCESTNAQQSGFSESEYYVVKRLKQIISQQIGRIFISSFASNLSRIEQIIAICVENNRKICLMGRSMETNVTVSRKIGYLNVSNEYFISPNEIANYQDHEIAILLTGSQGEELAALSQIANGKHHYVSFKPSDTVILSSNPIPGNFLSVEKMINQIYKCGVKVYENRPDFKIHASGHATQTELQLLIKILNPTQLVPIHGEYKMLSSLKALAELVDMDASSIKVSTLGQKLELYDGVIEITDEFVQSGVTYIDGNQRQTGDHLNNDSWEILQERQNISNNGIFSVLIMFNKKTKQLQTDPIVSTRGCFYAKTNTWLINKISSVIKQTIQKEIELKNEIPSKDYINKKVFNISSQYIWRSKHKTPKILTNIIEI